MQATLDGRRRKGGDVELQKCELLEMLQYNCVVEGRTESERHRREARVVCRPVERWFRRYVCEGEREILGCWSARDADGDRCRDRKGEFMVETTAWEGER